LILFVLKSLILSIMASNLSLSQQDLIRDIMIIPAPIIREASECRDVCTLIN
jgi:hypothetical protein